MLLNEGTKGLRAAHSLFLYRCFFICCYLYISMLDTWYLIVLFYATLTFYRRRFLLNVSLIMNHAVESRLYKLVLCRWVCGIRASCFSFVMRRFRSPVFVNTLNAIRILYILLWETRQFEIYYTKRFNFCKILCCVYTLLFGCYLSRSHCWTYLAHEIYHLLIIL